MTRSGSADADIAKGSLWAGRSLLAAHAHASGMHSHSLFTQARAGTRPGGGALH